MFDGFMGIVLLVAVILAFATLMRYLKFRERMAMIERGLAPSTEPDEVPVPRSPARHLVTVAVGLALTIGLGTLGFGPWLLGGLIPMFVGVAGLIGYVLETPQGVRSERGKGGDSTEND